MISLPVLAVSAAAVIIKTAEVERRRGRRAAPRGGRRADPHRGPRPGVQAPDPSAASGASGRGRLRRPARPRTTYARSWARTRASSRSPPAGRGARLGDRVIDFSTTGVDLSDPLADGPLRPRDRAPARGARRGRRQRRDARQGLRPRRRARGRRRRRCTIVGVGRDATARDHPVVLGSVDDLPSESTNVREWLVEAGPVSWSHGPRAQRDRRRRHLARRAGRPARRRVDGRADGLRHRQRRDARRRRADHRDGADRGRPAGRPGVRRRRPPPRPHARPDRRLGRHAGPGAPGHPRQRRRARPGRLGASGSCSASSPAGPCCRWCSGSAASGSARSSCRGSTSPRSWPSASSPRCSPRSCPAWLASRQDVVAVLAGRRGDRRPRAVDAGRRPGAARRRHRGVGVRRRHLRQRQRRPLDRRAPPSCRCSA